MGTTAGRSALRRRLIALGSVIVVAVAGLITGPAAASTAAESAPARAFALSGSSFNAGYIIDDANFYQKSAMSQAQIQAFLESKVTCTNSNCLANLYAKTEARANDRNICLGYTPDSDAKERASTIIYKVQQSCGISARVLLVTLQKEQGLIGKPAPTVGQLNAAMGYRCPDTAPCSGQAAGFFRQIYGAAWQFRRYSYPDLWGNYHIGTYSIAYTTKASCGRKTVNIRNNATAALYNYTPYTPNAGALANLRGTATCGSYGNRNFWVFYNDWFGNPLAGAGENAINSQYETEGGATGVLGAKVSTGTCGLKSLSCSKTYEHGVIYWSAATSVVVVKGFIGDYYVGRGGTGGKIGLPTGPAVPMSGPNGDGRNQPFKNALLISTSTGAYALMGTVRTKHSALGGVNGSVGFPTSDLVCTGLPNKACQQTFQKGSIFTVGTKTMAVSVPEIQAYYTSTGGPTGTLGLPAADAVVMNGAGYNQPFVAALVSSSPAGTFALTGAIRTAHGKEGGVAGKLGWPTGEAVCDLPDGGCRQTFEHGTIYSKGGKGFAVWQPAILAYYNTAGGPTGAVGMPTSAATAVKGKNGSGYNQAFQNALVSSSSAGAFALTGKFRTEHAKRGGVAGSLGFPTGDQVCGLPNSGCSQTFQHGKITVDSAGVRVTTS